jgi:hypothetical protein
MTRPILLLLGAAAAAPGARFLLLRRGAAPERADHETRLACGCGAEYRVVGTGRHRVVWPADAGQDQAVMGKECPACGRPLAA